MHDAKVSWIQSARTMWILILEFAMMRILVGKTIQFRPQNLSSQEPVFRILEDEIYGKPKIRKFSHHHKISQKFGGE